MSTHNIRFHGEIKNIIPELSPNNPPLQFLYDISSMCVYVSVHVNQAASSSRVESPAVGV